MADKVDIELTDGQGITYNAGTNSSDRIIVEHFHLDSDDAIKLAALIKGGETLTVEIKEKG